MTCRRGGDRSATCRRKASCCMTRCAPTCCGRSLARPTRRCGRHSSAPRRRTFFATDAKVSTRSSATAASVSRAASVSGSRSRRALLTSSCLARPRRSDERAGLGQRTADPGRRPQSRRRRDHRHRHASAVGDPSRGPASTSWMRDASSSPARGRSWKRGTVYSRTAADAGDARGRSRHRSPEGLRYASQP